jgi:hypothetical protein
MPTPADFWIEDSPPSNLGYDANAGDDLALRFATPDAPDVYKVEYQVHDGTGGLLASLDAPPAQLVPAGGVPDAPSDVVRVQIPATGVHTYLVRCVANDGVDAATGRIVPEWTRERVVAVRSLGGLRKVIPGERQQYSARGYIDEQNRLVDAVSGGVSLPPPSSPSTGRIARALDSQVPDGFTGALEARWDFAFPDGLTHVPVSFKNHAATGGEVWLPGDEFGVDSGESLSFVRQDGVTGVRFHGDDPERPYMLVGEPGAPALQGSITVEAVMMLYGAIGAPDQWVAECGLPLDINGAPLPRVEATRLSYACGFRSKQFDLAQLLHEGSFETVRAIPGARVTPHVWHHVVWRRMQDGTVSVTVDASSGGTDYTVHPLPDGTPANPRYFIGRDFFGVLNSVAIWSDAMSNEQVRARYESLLS